MKILNRLLPIFGKFHSKELIMTYKKYPTKDVILNARKENSATIFDVSHMNYLQIKKNELNIKNLEYLFPVNLSGLKNNKSVLSVVLDEKSNVLDDFIITNDDNENYRLIVNSENISLFDKYLKYKNIGYSIIKKHIIAIQGDGSNNLLKIMNLPTTQKFMENINHNDLEISRCGYTGMDGFEIIGNEKDLTNKLTKIMDMTNVRFGGLIERDILRLEAGFCLSGNEFGENKNIHFNETNLDFIVKKKRRKDLNFIGGKYFNKKPKIIKKRIKCKGSLTNQKNIYDEDENKIGFITSSVFSYNDNCFIGIGYIDINHKDKSFIIKNNKKINLEIFD